MDTNIMGSETFTSDLPSFPMNYIFMLGLDKGGIQGKRSSIMCWVAWQQNEEVTGNPDDPPHVTPSPPVEFSEETSTEMCFTPIRCKTALCHVVEVDEMRFWIGRKRIKIPRKVDKDMGKFLILRPFQKEFIQSNLHQVKTLSPKE